MRHVCLKGFSRAGQLRNLGESDIAETMIKLSSLLGTEAIEHPYLTLCSLARCCLSAVRSFIRTTDSLFPLHLYFLPARTMVDSVNQSPGVEVRLSLSGSTR